MNAIERANKLIALSESPNENEANSAARQACRVILKNKLCLVYSEPAITKPAPVYKAPKRKKYRWIEARTPVVGTCKFCNCPYYKGDRVWVVEDQASTQFLHKACGDKILKKAYYRTAS